MTQKHDETIKTVLTDAIDSLAAGVVKLVSASIAGSEAEILGLEPELKRRYQYLAETIISTAQYQATREIAAAVKDLKQY